MAAFVLISCLLSLLWVSARGHVGGHNRNTTSGEVKGVFMDYFNVTKYLGIPYAEAPVGELRFKPPVRKSRMDGVYNATSNSFICPQPFEFPRPIKPIQTEDCLRLDVYAPLAARKSNPLPVMVWVHGGGYAAGDSNTYDSTFLAAQGQVIVVAINYRLGILGFLNTMDENSMGNFGLLDQCSAIEWVVDNIAEFGGNASQITIFGESAGASSVMQLAMSALCVGQFQRVIAQSGAPHALWTHNNDPNKSAEDLAVNSGCPKDSAGLVKCLRSKSIKEILDNQMKSGSLFDKPDWIPTYSKDIFPDNPLEIMKGTDSAGLRRFRSLDFLSGVCYEEGELEYRASIASMAGAEDPSNIEISLEQAKVTDNQFEERLNRYLGLYLEMNQKERDETYPVIKYHFTDWKNRHDEHANLGGIIEFESDIKYNLGAIRSAKTHSSEDSAKDAAKPGRGTESSTYFYQLVPKPSWQPERPWQRGATHADDIFFVFGFIQYLNSSDAEKQLEREMITYWTNFAKSGSPNEPEKVSLTWPMFDKHSQQYIQLDLPSKIDMYPYARRFAFWDSYFLPRTLRMRAEEKPGVILSSGMTLQFSSVLGISICISVFCSLL